jgi:hypothetical protein
VLARFEDASAVALPRDVIRVEQDPRGEGRARYGHTGDNLLAVSGFDPNRAPAGESHPFGPGVRGGDPANVLERILHRSAMSF